MDKALLVYNNAYNKIDRKHTDVFNILRATANESITSSHCFCKRLTPHKSPAIGAKSNCSCMPELQSVFTVLSNTEHDLKS